MKKHRSRFKRKIQGRNRFSQLVSFLSFLIAAMAAGKFVSADDVLPSPLPAPIAEIEPLAPPLAESTTFSEWRFAKLSSVLSYVGLAPEPAYEDETRFLSKAQTRAEFERILAHYDSSKNISRYASWDDSALTVYLDRDTKKVPAYVLPFAAEIKNFVKLKEHLLVDNSVSTPLAGLRIALDPGHMGGEFWDNLTKKFIQIGDIKVSEGTMTLQTCLLLREKLEALGATVLMTRSTEGAVSALPFETYPLRPFAREEILGNTDDPWFDALLSSEPLGEALLKKVASDPTVQSIFNADKRTAYYIKRLDLQARADKINAFQPDLTLVVHFDGLKNDQLQNDGTKTRAYIPGNVFPDEWASNAMRFQHMRAVMSGNLWSENQKFAESVVSGLSQKLGIPKMTTPVDFGGTYVSDGVYARNLALNRLIGSDEPGVLAYVEVMHYDYAPEFERLSNLDRKATIDGIEFSYSSRLDDVVEGLLQGVMDYVESNR